MARRTVPVARRPGLPHPPRGHARHRRPGRRRGSRSPRHRTRGARARAERLEPPGNRRSDRPRGRAPARAGKSRSLRVPGQAGRVPGVPPPPPRRPGSPGARPGGRARPAGPPPEPVPGAEGAASSSPSLLRAGPGVGLACRRRPRPSSARRPRLLRVSRVVPGSGDRAPREAPRDAHPPVFRSRRATGPRSPGAGDRPHRDRQGPARGPRERASRPIPRSRGEGALLRRGFPGSAVPVRPPAVPLRRRRWSPWPSPRGTGPASPAPPGNPAGTTPPRRPFRAAPSPRGSRRETPSPETALPTRAPAPGRRTPPPGPGNVPVPSWIRRPRGAAPPGARHA